MRPGTDAGFPALRHPNFRTVMFVGTAPVGSLVLGALADRFGAPVAALFSGAISLAAAVWLLTRLRRAVVEA